MISALFPTLSSVLDSSTKATISPHLGRVCIVIFRCCSTLGPVTAYAKAQGCGRLSGTVVHSLIFADDFRRSYVCRCSLQEWCMLLANSCISSSFLHHSDSITWVTNKHRSALHSISCVRVFFKRCLQEPVPFSRVTEWCSALFLYRTMFLFSLSFFSLSLSLLHPIYAHHKQVLMVVIPDQERPLTLRIYH